MLDAADTRVLRTGIILAVAYLALIGYCAVVQRELAQLLIAVTVTNVAFGRAAGMSLGYAFGFGHGEAMLLNVLIESIMVLLFYPFFVLSLQQVPNAGWLRRLIDDTRAAAERHEATVRRFGIPGLALFVWSPFSMTGPVVGCAIGYLIGLRTATTIATVLISTALAVFCWGLVLGSVLMAR